MTENRVSLQAIYDEVIQHYSWGNYEEAKKRLLRKKYAFLQKNLVLCDPEQFKEKGTNYVPANDAPIIRELLIEAVNDSEESMVVDWFNGRVDTSDSLTATLLFMQLKPLIMKPYIMGETDEVTMDEWLNTVSAAINHATAKNTLALKNSLERFRNNSLPLDASISYGDVIATHEDGSRSYGLRGDRTGIDIRGKTIEQILDVVATQNDYFSVLAQMLELFNAHAKSRAKEQIVTYAMAKKAFEAEKADEAIDRESLASEYVIWYQRVHEFLVANPEVCKEIEEQTGESGLVEFFRMQGR